MQMTWAAFAYTSRMQRHAYMHRATANERATWHRPEYEVERWQKARLQAKKASDQGVYPPLSLGGVPPRGKSTAATGRPRISRSYVLAVFYAYLAWFYALLVVFAYEHSRRSPMDAERGR